MRKAQLTMYILFGIIILVATGSAIYLAGKFGLEDVSIEPKEFTIKNYIEDCLQNTGKDAIIKLGEHGGYIDPQDITLSKKQFNLNTNPTRSDALYLSPPNQQPVIYWWHLESENNCNDCKLTTQNMPTIKDQTTQIENYVVTELPKCLNNFEPFLKQAYYINSGNKTAKTMLTETDIKIILTMPTQMSKSGSKIKQETFETTIDVPLKKINLLAQKITQDQITKQRMENLFLHQLAAYSDSDLNKLPPISSVTHTPTRIIWTKPAVEQNVKQLLLSMSPFIKINNTKMTKQNIPKNAIEKGIYESMTYQIENVSSKELSVDFNYLEQIYFNIGPTSQNKLLPDTDRTSFPLDLAAPFQTNYYEFFYDVSAPILVQIKAQNALNTQGYTFNFGLEMNIRRNKNLAQYYLGEGTIAPWDSTTLTPNVTATSHDFKQCEKLANNKFKCPIDNSEYNETRFCAQNCKISSTQTTTQKINKSFFCNEEQKISGNIKIVALDATNNNLLQNAAVTYICGTQLACTIGTTNQRGVLRQKLPICYNGLLKITTDGYMPYTELLTTQQDKREDITAKLEQIKTINLSVKKMKIKIARNSTKECCDQDTLNSFEKVILTFERIKENPWQSQFTDIINYDSSQQKHNIELTPGKYKITAMLVDTLGFAIPKGCKSICTSTNANGDCTGQTFYPQEDQIFKPAMLGGIIIDEETGFWNLDSKTLDKTKTIEVNVAKLLTPNCIDTTDCLLPNCIGLDELGSVAEYSKKFKSQLLPKVLMR